MPIYLKFSIEIPIDCPFHPSRDLFFPQQNAIQRNRPTQFTCKFCGKSFYEERYLDAHFESRHKNRLNFAEDAVCLSDFCDILRCEVLAIKDFSLTGHSQSSTDIELYNEAAALAAARKEVSKLQEKGK